MELDFNSKFTGFDDYEQKYLKIMDVTLKLLKYNIDPIVSVTFVDNKYIHKINKKYRDIDRPTDVISFAFLDNDPNREELMHKVEVVALGDIYISIEKAKEQAEEYGHSLDRELQFLFTHGFLHLLGFDHMKEDDEKIMFDLQDQILEKVGV